MPLKFSKEAQMLIKQLKDFDEKDFKEWYENVYFHIIGSTQIIHYIQHKADKEKGDENGVG